MIYLKTIFSALNEIKYIKLNLKEAFDHIDKFIICEFNRTHIGTERELIFEKYFSEFSKKEKEKIIYIGADLSREAKLAKSAEDSGICHNNERLIRGYFVKHINLKDEDIVFSVDADEIIYSRSYGEIIKKLNKIHWPFIKVIKLPMNQFFYKINYLWENLIFTHSIACKATAFNKRYPSQWRDKGKNYPEIVGCHFSWCLSIEEMIQKLKMYAHHYDYGHFAKKEILEDAIKNKKYPFDPKRDFKIKVLDIYKDREYYPQSIYGILDEFNELIGG